MAFWGCSLKAGQKQKVEVSAANVLHLSQVCLHQPTAGKAYLQVQVDGKTYSIGCLEKDKVETLAFDLFFSEAPTFVNTGKSELHLSGYTEPKGTGEDDMDEDGESEEQVPAKKVAPAKAASPKVQVAASPKAQVAAAPAKAQPKAQPKAAEDDEGEESEEEEGEESEEELAPAPKAKAKAKNEPAKKAQEPAAAAPEKRKAAEAEAPSKKKAKAGDAPGSPKPAAASGDEEGYCKALVDFLKKNGKTKLSDLGSKVKRPEGVPKMKAMFTKHAGKFALDGEIVSLK